MPINLDLIAQQRQQRLIEEAQRKQEEGNQWDPLASIVGAALGFVQGGPMGAAMGAVSGMGATKGQGSAGLAQAGLGGYQLGTQANAQALKDKYAKILSKPKNQAEWVQAAMGLYPEEVVKGVFSKPLVNMGESGDVQTKSMLDSLFNTSIGNTNQTDLKSVISQARTSGLTDAQILELLLK